MLLQYFNSLGFIQYFISFTLVEKFYNIWNQYKHHHNTVPPSITMVLPVAKEKLALAMLAATLATSSGLPHLFIEGSLAALFLSVSVIELYVANVAMLPSAIV